MLQIPEELYLFVINEELFVVFHFLEQSGDNDPIGSQFIPDLLMSEIKDADTRDAAMIAAGQAAEHYEITRYGTLVSWAKLLGHKDLATILEKTLKEEYGADDKLTKLAERRLNKEAA